MHIDDYGSEDEAIESRSGRMTRPLRFPLRPELRKAMGVLKMLAQNELERELYEGRLKAKRDMQTLETLRDQWQQRYEAANQEREVANQEREAANRELRRELAERINLCQRLLRRAVSKSSDLLERSVEDLREQAQRLERELTQGSSSI